MTAVLPQSTEQPLMASLWSHRPQSLHLGLFIAAYVLGCGFAQLLAIVPGTGISIWPPSGLRRFMPYLPGDRSFVVPPGRRLSIGSTRPAGMIRKEPRPGRIPPKRPVNAISSIAGMG